MAPRARTEYEIGIKDDTSRALAKIDAGFTKLNASALALGAAGAGAAVGAFLTSRTLDAVNLADQLNKASQRTGVAVEALSQYQYAAELADVSNETLTGSLSKLARNMDAAAQGSKEQSAAFDAIGVSVKNADGTLRATQDVFDDIAVALARLPDGATKTALAMSLFGRAGAQLIPLLNGNADGFRAVRKEADALGVTFSSDLAARSEELKDNLTRLDKAGSALGITLASNIVPGLADFTTEVVKAYGESEGLLRTFDALAQAASRTLRGSDQQRLGELLLQETDLETKINKLQADFNRGAEGKLVYTVRMRSLKEELEATRKEAEGLRAVMQPEEFGGAANKPKPDNSAGEEERRREEARVRAALETAEAAKKRTQEEERLAEAQAKYLDGLRQQYITLDDSSQKAKVLAEITAGAGRAYSEETKQQALALADGLDSLKETTEVHEYLNGLVRERAQLDEQVTAQFDQELASRKQDIIDSLQTPLEKYTESVKELLALGFEGEQLQRGIEKYRGELEKADEKANKLKDTGRELGLTFTSAAEDALVKWEGFGNLLEGLAADIQRIFIRKTFTEPLADILGNAFSGGLNGLFDFGGGGNGFSNAGGLGLTPNARGGLYRVGGAGSEHPVAFTAKAGEYVAVGTRMEGGGSGGGAPVINIYNQNGSDIQTRPSPDGRAIEVFVSSALERNVSRGNSRLGLRPPMATR